MILSGQVKQKSKPFNNPIDTEAENLEDKINFHQRDLQSESEKLESLSSQIHSMKQQLDLYQHEEAISLERKKLAESNFTKDAYLGFLKSKRNSKDISNLFQVIANLLALKSEEWITSKDASKNYAFFKHKMTNVNVDTLDEEIIQQAIPFWRDHQNLLTIYKKNNKGAIIGLDWVAAIIEYKSKRETIDSLKKKFVDFQKEVKSHLDLIAEIKANITDLNSRRKVRETNNSNETIGHKNYRKVSFSVKENQYTRENQTTQEKRVEYFLKIETKVQALSDKQDKLDPNKKRVKNVEDGNKGMPSAKVIEDDTPKIITSPDQSIIRKLHTPDLHNIKDVSDIVEDTKSDLSQIFDLKINAHDSDFNSYTDASKPKPRPQSVEKPRGRNAISKQSLIIMNNLKMSQLGDQADLQGEDNVKKESTFDNDFESVRNELRKNNKISEEDIGQETTKGGRGFKNLKEMLTPLERAPQYGCRSERIKWLLQKKFPE